MSLVVIQEYMGFFVANDSLQRQWDWSTYAPFTGIWWLI